MITRSAPRRTLYLLLALVQLLLPPFAAVADAASERDSLSRSVVAGGAHIESTAAEGCPRVHPADCALCHAAGSLYTAALAVTLPPSARVLEASSATGLHSGAGRISQNPRQPRAPPATPA